MKILDSIHIHYSPRDRILSAISNDAIHWEREKGVRINAGPNEVADLVYYSSIAMLESGEYRMYFYGSKTNRGEWAGGIYSARSHDGLNWVCEPGFRIGAGIGHDELNVTAPSIYKLDDSRLRMYYTGYDQEGIGRILSAISSDGTIWEKEPGIRLEAADLLGVESLVDSCIVRVNTNLYRMYFSASKRRRTSIFSAQSTDGLEWKIEDGIRITNGALGRKLLADNPFVIRSSNQWIIYFRAGDNLALDNKIMWGTSKDGIVWNVEGIALSSDPGHPYARHGVAFPYVVLLLDGRWRMYYGGYWGKHFRENRIIKKWRKVTLSINTESLNNIQEKQNGN